MSFDNKVCVITGGANGIGFYLVNAFIRQGARVAFIDMDRDSGEKVLSDIRSIGGEAMFYHGDIAEQSVLEAFAKDVLQRYGRVDYLINNACLSRKGILSGCSYDDFNYVLRVGVTAPYFLAKLFRDHFNNGAAIVNIASTRASMSQMDTESYTAAKGGISSLTHALAVSLAGKVRVNSVSPGWIDVRANFDENYSDKHSEEDKKQHPAHRVGNPADIARTVLFLCSEENSFITGENITVDGGMTRHMIYHDDCGWSYNAVK